jgi:hypothetical protein
MGKDPHFHFPTTTIMNMITYNVQLHPTGRIQINRSVSTTTYTMENHNAWCFGNKIETTDQVV